MKVNKTKLFESLCDIYEFSRGIETWKLEKEVLVNIGSIADSCGLYEKFLTYLDKKIEDKNV